MKKIICCGLILITGLYSKSQIFSQLSFKTINSDSVLLSSYIGKKALFFIAPLTQSDPGYAQLQAFKNRYLDTVRIVGVLSYEDGYQSSNASAVQSLYSSMGVILTEGMYTKKGSGTNQSPLMKWMTDKTMNLHFDIDSGGIGHKFFVNENGRLFGVMPSQTPLNAPIIDKVVHSSAQ
jgi:glutathione peroxidase-family protein